MQLNINGVKDLVRHYIPDPNVANALDTLNLEAINMPSHLFKSKTIGDWRTTLPFNVEDERPTDALTYTIIDEMLKNGTIRFAIELKRANMVSPFRNKNSIKAHSADKELADITQAGMRLLLPHMANEFSWSALINGSAFMEGVWGYVSTYELGLSETPTDKKFVLPIGTNLVPHRTVRHILRKSNGEFDGFVQASDSYSLKYNPTDIIVKRDSALVIPYNGYSRNLWGESFLLPLYPLWFWQEIIIRNIVQFVQLMGDPPRLGKAPSRRKIKLDNSANLVDAIDYLLALSANLPKTNSVVIPSDFDENGKPEWELGYLQIPDRSQPLVQILELFNTLIMRAALTGDTAFTNSSTGSYAIGEIHSSATALHDEMVVTEWVHYLNKYFIPKIGEYNRGENHPPIWLEVKSLDSREREFMLKLMGIAGNSQTFQEFFYRVDWENLGRLAGIPMFTEEQADQLKKKLEEEGLEKQKNQLEMQKEFSDGQGNETGMVGKKNQEPTKQEINKKMEELAMVNRIPIFLSDYDMDRMSIESEPKIYQINLEDSELETKLAIAALSIME